MSILSEKISLALRTYYHSYRALKRQTSPEKITETRNAKLKRLISYSYNNIKYYRELFERHGIKTNDIKTAKDLVKLPVLTKEKLRKRFWDFLPRELPPCRVTRTSGSTGIPVCILSDNNSRLYNSAAIIRYRDALGIGFIGKPILTPLKTETERRKQPHWTFLQGVHKTFYVNPYANQECEIQNALKIIRKLKKPAIIGITPAIKALAYRIRDGIYPAIKPSAVLTTGECLSTQARELLEETFATKVTDIYACNEAGDIAWQCRKAQGYHINADNCIVEILKHDRPVEDSQVGEVVITNLNRYSMPIIRYKNGDLARFAQGFCQCGCRLPVIWEIIGRTGEDIYLQDGKTLPWNILKRAMNHNQIRQFQLVQNRDGSVMVKYLPEKGADTEDIEKLLKFRFSPLLPATVSLSFEKVGTIAPAPSGKSKLVVTHYRPKD